MTCSQLPTTGFGEHLGLFLIVAIACFGVGVMIMLRARSRRNGVAAALSMILIIGVAVAIAPGTPAQAAASECVTADNSLTITQTSTLEGLAPGIAPVAIIGHVVNNGTDTTYITSISVEISSVTTALGSPAGTCDASDFLLRDPRMIVGQTLSARGDSVAFGGASIAFSNKTTNQDACQNATIHLLYTANA